jgi:uncharacterized protein YdiU (UPF0061 family)
MPVSPAYRPEPRATTLPPQLSDVVRPASFPRHELRFRNQPWAERVGLGELSAAEWEAHFGRFEPLPSNLEQPLALRYHGHQFDVYNPRLGDGRGFLFAQLRDALDGRLLDLGTKGSGTTPYSRGGDGRLTLKGGVREVLATEMLEALGVYTSKSFSLFETGEALLRGDEPSPTRSSVLVRLSHSHVRIGTFQRLHFLDDRAGLQALFDYCIDSFYPALATSPDPAADFLREVTRRSADLCASWLASGFVHGVLNSDNMTITAESFDYGPYRFLPHYDPDFVAAYFDEIGLYSYVHQPRAVFRNLQRLSHALEWLASEPAREAALAGFMHELEAARTERLLLRLGVIAQGVDDDRRLAQQIWQFLAATRLPLDRFFFDWYAGAASASRALSGPSAELYRSGAFASLRSELAGRAAVDPECLLQPYFAGYEPCSLTIDEVERVWQAIAERDDWSAFDAKVGAIRELGRATGGARSPL